jgi:hypothetical protein
LSDEDLVCFAFQHVIPIILKGFYWQNELHKWVLAADDLVNFKVVGFDLEQMCSIHRGESEFVQALDYCF